MKQIRLITLAPGHFHAALVQKQMLMEVHPRSYVYGPLDVDTLAHLDRIAAFNSRPESATNWEVDLRAGPNWLDRFEREQPGNTVVLSGRNRPKIDLMIQSVTNGLNVLADKPWVVEATDFPQLEVLFREADLRELLVWDVMTERHEITNQLQRELVRDPEIFGRWQVGMPEYPALVLESIHHLKKTVAGRPLIRPWWWFEPSISGEAMADVGTHLADLALWFISPEQLVDYRNDVCVLDADRWPLVLSEDQFRALTNLPGYPGELSGRVVNEQLYYAGNNTVTFTLRGVHVKLNTLWEYEAPPGGGDTHTSTALGTKARIAIRQPSGSKPNLFIASIDANDHQNLVSRLKAKCEAWRFPFPGLAVVDLGSEVQLAIPDELRTNHEAHFAAVLEEYARYFSTPRAVPHWERPNALAKYYVTTRAVEVARTKRHSR